MKNLTILMVVFVFIMLGCSQKPNDGIYVNSKNPSAFTELKGGQFYFSGYGNAIVGKYEIEKNTITFIYQDGRAERATFNDTLIYDEAKNEKWILWKGGTDKVAYEEHLKGLVSSRDELSVILSEIAAQVSTACRKPVALGGGGGSFVNWQLPKWIINKYSKINLTGSVIDQNTVSVVAVGDQIGYDGANPMRIRCNITLNGYNTINEN